MTKRWQTRALGDLCTIQLGRTPPRANSALWDAKRETGNVWLSIADLLTANDKVVCDSKEYVSDRGAAICKLVPMGTLLVSFKLTLGRLAFAGRDLFTNEAIAALTVLNERELSKNFLYYCLSFYDWVKAAENDVKLKGMTLNKEKLKKIPISFPPLSEQERIVQLLDEAFEGLNAGKANAEKNLRNARAIFESYLHSVFTEFDPEWDESTLGAEIKFIDYRGRTPVKSSSGVRLITAKNVKMGYLQEAPREYIAAAGYTAWMTRGIPKKGDVLFTTEAPLANVAQLDTDEKVAFAQRIIVMQPDPARLDSTFLKYLLLSHPVQQRIRTQGTGATVQGIKASLLKRIAISFPKSLDTQRRIVSRLEALDAETQRLASLYERKVAAFGLLNQSLLHRAISGEL